MGKKGKILFTNTITGLKMKRRKLTNTMMEYFDILNVDFEWKMVKFNTMIRL